MRQMSANTLSRSKAAAGAVMRLFWKHTTAVWTRRAKGDAFGAKRNPRSRNLAQRVSAVHTHTHIVVYIIILCVYAFYSIRPKCTRKFARV